MFLYDEILLLIKLLI